MNIQGGGGAILSGGNYVKEYLPSNTDWFIVGTTARVIDGDTIEITAEHVGEKAKSVVQKGQTYTIRFAGVQTPETKKDGSYDDNTNQKFQSKYKLDSLNKVYNIANEAKRITSGMVVSSSSKTVIVVDLEAKFVNGVATQVDQDAYGRLVGMVYRASVDGKHSNLLDSKTALATTATNVNKTLIATESSVAEGVPVAEVYGTDEYGVNPHETGEQSRFDIAVWGYTYSFKADENKESIKTNADYTKRREKHEQVLIAYRGAAGKIVTISYSCKKGDNIYDIADSYNTSAFLIAEYNNTNITDLENNLYAKRVLTIPYIKDFNVEEITYSTSDMEASLRSNANNVTAENDRGKMRSDYHVRIGDVELVVPPLSIEMVRTSQAEKVKTLRSKQSMIVKVGSSQSMIRLQLYFEGMDSINGYETNGVDGDTYYMDGLRPLIAQFHKAPFLPIENEYINNVLDIHSVALINLSVSTVPGFPRSITATLELAKFEHEAYLPGVTFMEEVINYPLLRWYYQRSMTYKNPYRTYFAPIEGNLTNDFVFQVADEEFLAKRQEAVKSITSIDGAVMFEAKTDNGDNLFGKLIKDMERYNKVLEQYNRYKELKKENALPKKIRPGDATFDYIYGGKRVNTEAYFLPPEYTGPEEEATTGEVETVVGFFGIDIVTRHKEIENKNGLFILRLDAPTNQNIFYLMNTSENIYAIPAGNNRLGEIKTNGKSAELGVTAQLNAIDRLKQKAGMTEGEIPLVDMPIDNLILTGINVFYSNSFSSAQLQELETPTLQYLGGQDPNIRLTFEATSREAVEELRQLLDVSDRYSREYRYGITSGFFGFKNQLTQLFGVNTVICENMVVNTVPGFMDRFQIDMVLCGFSKTQKRAESLDGMALSEDTALAERQADKDPTLKDLTLFEYKLKELEVYPDLELPTVDELNAALPKMNLSIKQYPNPSKARYVDPDFYINTETTHRELLRALLEDPTQTRLDVEDYLEVKGYTEMNSTTSLFLDGDMLALMQSLDARTAEVTLKYSDVNSTYETGTGLAVGSALGKISGANYQTFKGTAYSPSAGGINAEGDPTIGSTGTKVSPKRTIAVAPKVIPYGSIVHIYSDAYPKINGIYLAEDTGGAIRNENGGYRVDILMEPLAEALAFGRKDIQVAILERGAGAEDARNKAKNWEAHLTKYASGGQSKGGASASFPPYPNPQGTLEVEHKNPTYLQVYKEIEKWVDQYFVANNLVANDKGKQSEKKYEKITYARTEDIYRASYNTLAERKGKKKIEKPKGITQGNFESIGSKITRERMINIIKSLLHHTTGWKQFDGTTKPVFTPSTSAVGMGKVRLNTYGTNQKDKELLSWDWRYNVRRAVGIYYEHYMVAKNSKSIEVYSRPWDWAIRAYEQGDMIAYNTDDGKAAANQGKLTTPFYLGVLNILEGADTSTDYRKRTTGIYSSPSARYASPGGQTDSDIRKYLSGASDTVLGIVEGDRKTLIKQMVEHNSDDSVIKKALEKLGDKKLREEFIKLEGTDMIDDMNWAEQVINWVSFDKFYEKEDNRKATFKELVELITENKKHAKAVLGNKKLFSDEKIQDMYNEVFKNAVMGRQNSEEIGNFKEAQGFIQLDNKENNRLSIAVDPAANFKSAFTDMLEYDQRGRMIRAFPTFQMFIVDEGKWMSSYRLWDNLYGFNAILSIDVHKDRRIAADTAVIEMSNVYSNLSSRRVDENYGDWDYTLGWNSMLWGTPSEELLKARKELADSMMLKTGARIHLRMGYSASASDLPIVFNGTITEMDAQSIVKIVAQGDGIELSNAPVSTDPNQTNDGGFFGKFIEPRDLLCEFLTSKGNWFKDVLNGATDGSLFSEHPLGIMHFGAPRIAPPANFSWFNDNYGEAAQNIYSSNGMNTFSQWIYGDGEKIDGPFGFGGTKLLWPDGDEQNIELKLYGLTYWDVAQTIAYCTPDYMAAVLPFSLRSTLFFGKPYYEVAYRYDMTYKWSAKKRGWERVLDVEMRKPFMQYHVYDGMTDIISNQIKASEEGVYTNVVATYDGGNQTRMMYADFDIRFDKQKTSIVEAPIVADIPGYDKFHSERQAEYYAASTLRDYIKDMYKGSLIVLGDPTIKPYDMIHMTDAINDMKGPFLVKSVTHHFSHETGFITSIGPDAVVVIDDQLMLTHTQWFQSISTNLAAALIGRKVAAKGLKRVVANAKDLKLISAGKWSGRYALKLASYLPTGEDEDIKGYKDALRDYVDKTNAGKDATAELDRMQKHHQRIAQKVKGWETKGETLVKKTGKLGAKGLLSVTGGILDSIASSKTGKTVTKTGAAAVKTGNKLLDIGKGVGTVVSFGGRSTPIGVVVTLLTTAGSLLTETLSQEYQREKKSFQTVIVAPLKYQGRNYTAGLNGQAGMIVGTAPGRWDNFFSGLGFDGTGEGAGSWVGPALNMLLDNDGNLPWTEEAKAGTVVFKHEYENLNDGSLLKEEE